MSRPVRLRGSYLSVRAVSRLTGVPPQRLRRYEEEGLLVSDQVICAESGERLYATTLVQRIRRIRSYEQIGVNLAGIEVILRLLEQRARGRR